MVQHKRVRAIAIEPPCTSFSPAARPAVRSYKEPRGFCQENPKILGRKQAGIQRPSSALGRTLCRGFWTSGDTQEVKNGMAPRVALPPDPCGHKEVSTASCAFGSIHQKEFRFLTCNMVPDSVSRRCRRDHHHVKIEGQITKGKAVYCPGLVRALGSLRAGGATYLQMLLEDSELTRRRGRWLSGRTMEIYPHESSATTYFPQLPPETKKRIMQAANSFATMLKKVIFFYQELYQDYIPSSSSTCFSDCGEDRWTTDGKRREAWQKDGSNGCKQHPWQILRSRMDREKYTRGKKESGRATGHSWESKWCSAFAISSLPKEPSHPGGMTERWEQLNNYDFDDNCDYIVKYNSLRCDFWSIVHSL